MRKNVFGRQFKRDKNERTALFKGLISSLVLHERIKTTEDKAKAIRADVDKIITKAKKGGMLAKYLLRRQLPERAIEKLIVEIAPRFKERRGGYTRIIKFGRRFFDNAPMVLMEWTERNLESEKIQKVDEKATQNKKAKKIEEKSSKMVKKIEIKETKTKK